MSENLSIDEIIKKAEEIKKEAEKQLNAAEKSLDEKAKCAIDEVVVDEQSVVERIAKVYEKIDNEDDDVKEYIPPSKKQQRPFTKAQPLEEEEDDEDEDIKIVPDGKTREVSALQKEKTGEFNLKSKSKTRKFTTDGKTKPMMYVSKVRTVDDDSDLQEMPMIVAKEHIYDGFVKSDDEAEEDVGVQMTFEGFEDLVENVPKIDEEVAEQILLERRQEKVGKFRLFGPDETDTDLGTHKVVKEDYVNLSEKDSFMNNLLTKKNSIRLKLIATLWLMLPMVLMTVFKDSAYFPAFLSTHTSYFVFAAVLFGAALAANNNIIVHGFDFRRRFNYDLPISIVALAIMAHTVIMTVNQGLWIDNGVLLILPGTFALFMSQLAKSRMMSRIIDNFNFITGSSDKYTLENITNAVDAEIISRGLIEGDPLIKTSVKTDFPTNFMEISTKREAANKAAKIIFPLSVLLSVVLFVVTGVLDNFNTAFNMTLCSLAISMPCCVAYLCNTMLYDISKGLGNYGARVCGFEGAAMACDANIMVMEAADLFDKNSCEMHGFKTFEGTQVYDAVIYTAAVMTQTKSPLARVFDKVIIGKQSLLPNVEDITYENQMGISAWIYKRKVLVGNRDLLKRHGVDVPTESFEKRYTTKGKKALYLAIDGRAAAMFIVSYSADPDLKRELRKLEKSGITIIVKSSDPYINEESIAKLFSLPKGFVRVMNYSAARVYDKYSNMHVEKSPSYVVHDGTAMGFVSAMHSAEIIMSSGRLITFLSCFGSAIGFAVIALLSVLESYQSITAVNIILFQLIWNVFIYILNKIKGISL